MTQRMLVSLNGLEEKIHFIYWDADTRDISRSAAASE
jgi:hypothetical protein